MPFNSYQEGLKVASDLGKKAIQTEASLSSLSPVASPIPILKKAFPIYISAAEAYGHLLSSKLVPPSDIETVKRKWRLVLERAEKVKSRIEQLGGHVAKAEIGDRGEEKAVLRRASLVNGVAVELWQPPGDRFDAGESYREAVQPELAAAQLDMDPEWKDIQADCWLHQAPNEGDWVMRQGPVSDCSVVAAMGVGVKHGEQFGTAFGWENLYPQDAHGRPRRSENGKHILKLLLNGAWRSVVLDSLLPFSKRDKIPLFTTCHPTPHILPTSVGSPWAPLALKGYFKVHGGYSLRGSNPSSDIYEFMGWIPERIGLKEGFQREKEWKRMKEAWHKGNVMVSLGTGNKVSEGLVKLHAYGVIRLREEGHERILDIFDPGATSFTMSWDQVCAEFEALHLNWKPSVMPNTATRHWSWPKPPDLRSDADPGMMDTRYRLHVNAPPSSSLSEVWILLSQHITSRDRPLDDIALHVFEDLGPNHSRNLGAIYSEGLERINPYTNSNHLLVRYQLRRPTTDLTLIPSRDRGMDQTGFTLNVFAPASISLSLDRISRTLPFTQRILGNLTDRSAGGHPGWPTHMTNPQYKVVVRPGEGKNEISGRIVLHGEKDVPWNAKLIWGKGQLVYELSEDLIVADTGSYSYGIAYCDIPDLQPDTYTLIVSAFEPGQTGLFSLSLEATAPVSIIPIAAEGAGMYNRVINGSWTERTAGGRPSGGTYESNPRVEVVLSRPAVVQSRLYLPTRSPVPINLTIFERAQGGALGKQLVTTGPYSDSICGVSTGKMKLDSGVYLLVPSSYERSKGAWVLKIWSDVALSAEIVG
ncbi:calpain-like protease palB/RIM13 [Cryptococcus neoformans]|nr:calpain-like protease palB/RIM13 [Cryptococcus neoformans var. grubii]OXC57566.1 calpain-like protease palB/RIM13 [Cryptococcus neoformans var. grubii MW-RSA852]UOH85030.1 calpain-like protease palB/RIM13 [Cryptococcus neoformans]